MKNKNKIFLRLITLSVVVLFSSIAFSQNPREENRFGFNYLNLGSPSILLSLSVDYFVTPSVDIEVGAGLIGYYGGIKYHFMGNSEKNWTPYLGAFGGTIAKINLTGGDKSQGIIYFPLGMQYTSDGGFTFGIEAAGIIVDSQNSVPIWGAIKLGHHF